MKTILLKIASVVAAFALVEPAVAEGVRADPAGYRCIENTQGAGTEIARPTLAATGPDPAQQCNAACEGTRGCIAYNIVHRVEGGREQFFCVLLGSVSGTDPYAAVAGGQWGALCYRLAGPVPPGSARDCPPHKPGCVPPRPFLERQPSAADDRPGQARPPASAPSGKK